MNLRSVKTSITSINLSGYEISNIENNFLQSKYWSISWADIFSIALAVSNRFGEYTTSRIDLANSSLSFKERYKLFSKAYSSPSHWIVFPKAALTSKTIILFCSKSISLISKFALLDKWSRISDMLGILNFEPITLLESISIPQKA